MKRMYIAVQTEENGKYYAHAIVTTHEINLKKQLENKSIIYANICETRKQAERTVEAWNERSKENGVYLFSNAPFN